MLHFRINILLFAYGAIGSEGVSKLRFSFERAAMKTQYFSNTWKVAFSPFCPPVTTSLDTDTLK